MRLVDSQLQRPKPRHRSAPASLARIHWTARLGTAGAMLLMALAAVPRSASAQGMGGMGGMGGGGMGGGGGRGGGRGGRGGRSGGDESAQRGLSSSDVAKQIKELASLDRALDDVPDLDGQKKDSLKAIQGRYERIFESYAIAARNKVDSVRAAGGTPSVEDIRELRQEADSVRTGELVAARAVLTTDEQRGRFDRNVDDIRADEAKRQGESGKRRGSGGMGRGGMGGATQPPL